ncbi:MAG TPA: zf-HC2 domain-containing protein [Kofleriaceae bacterium]
MNCDDVRPQLTSYLDGELEDDRGSAVRGHLRECDACRAASDDEATLRDGLRALPSLDVPSTLWAGVQRQLADAEVADAHTPRWRRVMRRWAAAMRPQQWMTPRFALASSAVAVIVVVWAWRYTHRDELPAPQANLMGTVAVGVFVAPHASSANDLNDVATEIAAVPKQMTDDYAQATLELVALAQASRTQWPDDRKQVFDAKLAELQRAVDGATEGRPRQKAYRALIRYLQRVTTRDEVAFANVGGL